MLRADHRYNARMTRARMQPRAQRTARSAERAAAAAAASRQRLFTASARTEPIGMSGLRGI